MENFRSFQHQKRGSFTASPSSFARPARPFAPLPSPSLQPASLDGEAQLEHARRFGHSLDRVSIFPPEQLTSALPAERQSTDHTMQQKHPVQEAPQTLMESISAESAQSETRPRGGWNFAHIPLFPDPATIPSTNTGSFASVGQRLLMHGAEPRRNMQGVSPFANQVVQRQNVPPKKNSTGLPNPLKAGVENLSAISMDDVQVHYNSPKPASVQALAYTQGADIHVGPGQEQYLSHEAWHVVQQKQGRVKPSTRMKGINVNVDSFLEKEADVMGTQANNILSVQSRLPSAVQSERSSQLLGQSLKTTQRFPSGSPVRQFACGSKSRNYPPARISQEQMKGEEEAESKGKEEAESKGKEEAESKGKEEAATKGMEEAESKGMEEVASKGMEEERKDDGKARISEKTVKNLQLEEVETRPITTYVREQQRPGLLQKFLRFRQRDASNIVAARKELPTVLYHPKKTIILYHATLTKNVESIIEQGIQPSKGGGGGAKGLLTEPFNASGYVYLATTPKNAQDAARNFYGDVDEADITVLAVTLDENTVLVQDPDLASAVRTTRPLENVRKLNEGEEEKLASKRGKGRSKAKQKILEMV